MNTQATAAAANSNQGTLLMTRLHMLHMLHHWGPQADYPLLQDHCFTGGSNSRQRQVKIGREVSKVRGIKGEWQGDDPIQLKMP